MIGLILLVSNLSTLFFVGDDEIVSIREPDSEDLISGQLKGQ